MNKNETNLFAELAVRAFHRGLSTMVGEIDAANAPLAVSEAATEAPAPKRRGRPVGTGKRTGKRRGRPPGTGKAKAAKPHTGKKRGRPGAADVAKREAAEARAADRAKARAKAAREAKKAAKAGAAA